MRKLAKWLSVRSAGYFFIWFLLIAGIIRTASNLNTLVTGSYKVNPQEIVRIDTFLLQGKADYYRSRGAASRRYEFKSTTGHNFTIKGAAFKGITDINELDELLKHHELSFTVYSDQATLDLYKKSKVPAGINVLQFEAGGKKYISIEKGNLKLRKRLLTSMLTESVLIITLAVLLVLGKWPR